MLTIRHEQMKALSDAFRAQLQDQLVRHVRETLPESYAKAGEAGTRENVRYAMRQAGRYGIQTNSGVAAFTKVMFIYGPGFESNPAYDWARSALQNPALSESERIARLVEGAV